MGAISRFEPREQIDFAAIIGTVATELWGEPNKRLSKPGELRWGNQGARIVYPETGAYKDTEADRQGGTLDLIQHVRGGDRADAMAWMADRGMIPAAAPARRVLRPTSPVPSSPSSAEPACQHGVRLDPGQRIVSTFEFRRGGALLYRKHRIEPGRGGRTKDFLYDHPDGRDGWRWGRGNSAQAPYRADDLDSADLIVMAEGEAKADKLAAWGYAATSLKDWIPAFGSTVSGKRVVILPDNDSTGAQLASKVADQVAGAGGQPMLLDLPRLPDKGDVLDWDGDAAELAALISGLGFPEPETFPIADLAAWSRTSAAPTPFYMAGHIPLGEVTLLTGAGGGNKSTFGQQLATCSAAGLAMLGVEVTQGPALYITAEDHEDRLHWMQEHLCRALGVDMASLAGKLFLASIRGRLNNELATFDADGRLQLREAFQLVRSTIETTGARLLVLDNVAHLFAGNENDRGHVTAFVNLLYVLCRELGVTILLIAHKNKAGDSYSGSTAWLNAVRSQLVIERPEDGHDPDARVMTVGKANYARPDQQLPFRWHDFALILDADLPDDRRAELAAVVQAGAENEAFLRCLTKAREERRATSPSRAASNYAPRMFAKMTVGKGLTETGFEAAMERLLHLGTIRGDQRVYQRENRTWALGLGCTNPCTNHAQSRAQSVHEAAQTYSTDPHAHVTLDTTYLPGAAHGAAAPDLEAWKENPALGRIRQPIEPEPDDIDWPDERTGEGER